MKESNQQEAKENKIIGKLYCLIGWHHWRWSLNEAMSKIKNYKIDETIPPFAKCIRCNKVRGG